MYKTVKQILKEAKAKATRDYNKKRKEDNKVFQRFCGLDKGLDKLEKLTIKAEVGNG